MYIVGLGRLQNHRIQSILLTHRTFRSHVVHTPPYSTTNLYEECIPNKRAMWNHTWSWPVLLRPPQRGRWRVWRLLFLRPYYQLPRVCSKGTTQAFLASPHHSPLIALCNDCCGCGARFINHHIYRYEETAIRPKCLRRIGWWVKMRAMYFEANALCGGKRWKEEP